MANFGVLIDKFLQSNPQQKSVPDFLAIKNGFLPLDVSYYNDPQPHQHLPTLITKIPGQSKTHHTQSSSFPIQYSLSNLIDCQQKHPLHSISDNIIQQSIRATSLKICQNMNNQLTIIQNQLGQIVQTGTVDVTTFSNNCITNLTKYDIQGNPIAITNAIIDFQVKKYIQVQQDQLAIYDAVPHPIRKKRKIRKMLNIEKKSQREIMEEFQIIYGLFNSKDLKVNQSPQQKQQNLNKILEAVDLTNNSYQQLWQKIIGDIKITKQSSQQQRQKQNMKQTERLGDDEFDKAIQRIVKEAVQYQKQAFDNQEEEQTGEQQQVDVEFIQDKKQDQQKQEEKKQMKQQVTDFDKAKIQKKTQLTPSSKYQYAIEDTSDLTNFYDLLPKQNFACSYKFELDQFQKRSVLHLQRKQSIFVAAHTSAGKTVVAEYGVALAIKHKRKVIYTSPIKALSNQKYRQLSMKFGSNNVGIVTGDVSMNQQASCIIMTTEILRNSLYRGAEMIRDIEWVIFDEVHYINNQERGVVWEETIIMLPEHVGIIMLSATVPNYMDFANWVGRTKHRIIYVMKTLHRPVPLQHSLYMFNKFHLIKQPNGRFLKQQYSELHNQIRLGDRNHEVVKKAMKEKKMKKKEEDQEYYKDKRDQKLKLTTKNAVDKFIKNITKADMETAQGREEHRLLQELIVDCKKKNLLPCVIFTFSKKKINALAAKIYTYDLTSHLEKSKIARMISSALSNLKPEDQQIDQFRFLREICMNGYAVHHGDLLPLAKQIVELLFSQGLIKVLFATETFAMGINMPTKTVIFNSIKKVTGSSGNLRFLNSSEYVQMSGRAGRRGLDQKGTVIIIVKDPSSLPQVIEMQKMVDYPGQRLQSKFRVTYQIILNLLNSSDFGVTQMLRQSFLQNPKFSEFTSNIKSFRQYQSEYQTLSQFQCPYNKLGTRILMDQYMTHSKSLQSSNRNTFQSYMSVKTQKNTMPRYAKLLGLNNQTQIGLILRVDIQRRDPKNINSRHVQVMVVNKQMIDVEINREDREKMEKQQGIKKRIILQYDQDKNNSYRTKFYKGEVPGTKNMYNYQVYWVSPSAIVQVYTHKIDKKSSPQDKKEDFQNLSLLLLQIPNKLQPISQNTSAQKQQNWLLFSTSQCHECQYKQKHQYQYERRGQVKSKLAETAKKLDTNQLGMMGSFEGMVMVLVQFGFVSQAIKEDGEHVNTLTLKGRIAKEVDVFVAQVIVQAVLDSLDFAQIAALLSAFVCDYKPRPGRGEQDKVIGPIPQQTNYTTNLTKAVGKTLKIVQNITQAQLQLSAYLNLDPSNIDQHIMGITNFHLVDTVYKWAIGFDFVQARAQSKAPQGNIVRTIMRLSQLLSNVKSVCRIIGNCQLEKKIDQALEAIKRDIVFCQSLYLSG